MKLPWFIYLSKDDIMLNKDSIVKWLEILQNDICKKFEEIENSRHREENPRAFTEKRWNRKGGGGGIIRVMRGKIFEKVGVNVSVVHGSFSPEMRKEIPGTENSADFFACGISLVTHMFSPKIPSIHMNTRYIETEKAWFGGGIDLTPTIIFPEDTEFFKDKLKNLCDKHDSEYYCRFSKACDDYFHIKHWHEPRGVGGIFYDYLNTGNQNKDFSFMQDVGKTILQIYPTIVEKHLDQTWTEQEKLMQLQKRAKYAEFNFLYDRGTRFGFMTEGNPEAILISMPPLASW